MALFSFSSSVKKETAIVLDIGSGSVGAAIVAFEKRARPTILYSTREDIAHYEHPGFKRFFRAMLNALETATLRLHRETLEKNTIPNVQSRDIEQIYCILASPWYTATTKILCYERNTPFTVTEALVNDLVEQSLRDKNNAPTQEQKEPHDTKLIEKKVIQILLNGYETGKPYGQNASSIEVALFTANVAQEIGSRVQSIIRKTWINRKISFHSFALASFTVTRDLFPQDDNFILLDVTGEVTDIYFSKNGALIETCSLPYGKNSMLRDVARTLQTTVGESLSLIREYSAKNTTDDTAGKLRTALDMAGSKWASLFEAIISYVMQTETIPHTVFLMADSDIGTFFKDWIHKETTGRSSFGGQRCVTTYLDDKAIEHTVRYSGTKERDFFIGINAAYLRILYTLKHM